MLSSAEACNGHAGLHNIGLLVASEGAGYGLYRWRDGAWAVVR